MVGNAAEVSRGLSCIFGAGIGLLKSRQRLSYTGVQDVRNVIDAEIGSVVLATRPVRRGDLPYNSMGEGLGPPLPIGINWLTAADRSDSVGGPMQWPGMMNELKEIE